MLLQQNPGVFDRLSAFERKCVLLLENLICLLHDGFVEAYYKWKEKADADPEWAKKHPMSYNVNLEGLSSKGI